MVAFAAEPREINNFRNTEQDLCDSVLQPVLSPVRTNQAQLLSTMSDAMTTLARVIVPPKERSLSERDLVSWGGYGIHISPCIEGTAACGDSCCPNSYKCASPGNYKADLNPEAICCPTGM